MNLQTLYSFQKVAHLEHFTEAAAQLNTSQPALSRTIHSLEEEIGVPLFNRTGNQITLNENGRLFLSTVENILQEMEQSITQIREYNSIKSRTIGLYITSAGVYIPRLIQSFKLRHPETVFNLCSNPNDLEKGYHFSIFASVKKSLESSVILAREPLFLTVGQNDPLAKASSVKLGDLANRNFLFQSPYNDMYEIQIHFCHEAGFSPDIKIVTDKSNILMNLIKIGEGISLLPYFTEQSHTENELIQIPVSDIDCYRYICLRPNHNVYETELAQKFQQFCISFFAKIEKNR